MPSLWSRFKSGVNSVIRTLGGGPPPAPVPEEPFGYPPEQPPAPPPIDEPPIEDDWFGEEITITNEWDEQFSLTKDQWFDEVLHNKEYLLDKYSLDNLDIIRLLEQEGFWTQRDWEVWRELYG